MRRLGLILVMLTLAVAPAQAERLITSLSREDISITSSFVGETLTLFGTIEPDAGQAPQTVSGPYQIIVTITGPLQTRVARRATNQFGIWINTQQVEFEDFPSFYRVLASAKLTDITDEVTLAERRIRLADQARASDASWWDAAAFGNELVRLMQRENHFGLSEQAVQFHSPRFYSARVTLPSDAAPGPYLAQTYLFKDGRLVTNHAEGFSVRKIGFERFLGQASQQYPLLYGLVAVILAIFTGWLGGVVFRR